MAVIFWSMFGIVTGTNLQALIDSCKSPLSKARIVTVISNKDGVKGLQRAQDADILTKVWYTLPVL